MVNVLGNSRSVYIPGRRALYNVYEWLIYLVTLELFIVAGK